MIWYCISPDPYRDGRLQTSMRVDTSANEAQNQVHEMRREPKGNRGVASQKVMEGQACPHETFKIVHDCKKANDPMVGYPTYGVVYNNLNN